MIVLLAGAALAGGPAWLVAPTSLEGRRSDRVVVQHRDGSSAFVVSTDVLADARRLDALPDVEAAWPAFAPVAPPGWRNDIPPATPSFVELQTWQQRAPVGMGVREAWNWPGGRGSGVTVADVEYSWDPAHEDLLTFAPQRLLGQDYGEFTGHGNAVLGIVGAAADGFGTTGAAPYAELRLAHPWDGASYDVGAAIRDATDRLAPGDVLLVEQQAYANGGFAPVTVDPLVADALAAASAAGITVVVPAGNGDLDLDAPTWEGWFEPGGTGAVEAIVVGAGHAGTGGMHVGTSNFGSAVDVQGWVEGVPAPSDPSYGGDLWFPNDDPHQAYLRSFGGTSGAAAQVAGLCAQVQGVSLALYGEPVPPPLLRRWLVSTAIPQSGADSAATPLGGRPDVERLLRTWMTP